MTRINEYGQPIGDAIAWSGAATPAADTVLAGRYVRVEPLAFGHAEALYAETCQEADSSRWTYLNELRPSSLSMAQEWVAQRMADPQHRAFALVPLELGHAAGRASYLRIDPENGSIEVGAILYGGALARTPAATEAMYLLAKHAFEELGYRRYEWKCDSLNAASRQSAMRLGFGYEGRFRQAMVYRNRNRDTDWFSIVDSQWPRLRAAYETWLDPGNFAADGQQRQPLLARTN